MSKNGKSEFSSPFIARKSVMNSAVSFCFKCDVQHRCWYKILNISANKQQFSIVVILTDHRHNVKIFNTFQWNNWSAVRSSTKVLHILTSFRLNETGLNSHKSELSTKSLSCCEMSVNLLHRTYLTLIVGASNAVLPSRALILIPYIPLILKHTLPQVILQT